MAYITNDDIELRLGSTAYVQLTDDASSGSASEAVVTAARVAAAGEVDSHLARRHQVPIDLDVHPELAGVLAAVALDLAEYRLHARRPPVPEDVAARHVAALEWLRAVGEGTVVLPSAVPIAGNPALGIAAAAIGNEAALTREEFEGL